MAYTQAMPSQKKRWKAENLGPKAHMSFTLQELNIYPECTTELDKYGGNSKGMKARKVMDLDGNEAYTQGPGITYLYPVNTWEVGYGSRV